VRCAFVGWRGDCGWCGISRGVGLRATALALALLGAASASAARLSRM
jgi:hypothetical protein